MIKTFFHYRKRAIAYFSRHVEYCAMIHALGGIGVGILISSPMAFPHPVRWGLVFLGASLIGHLYALHAKK
jgi:hypothetical protein